MVRGITRAVVEAALYFVVPRSEVASIPEQRDPHYHPATPVIPKAPPRSNVGRPRGGAKHPRAEYWREYARMRYNNDPEFRRRRREAAKRNLKRGAK